MRGSRVCVNRRPRLATSRPAFTLLETVLAVCILGLLVTGIIVAASRLARQDNRMARKQEALSAANALLAQWQAGGWQVPSTREGKIGGTTQEGSPSLRWVVTRQTDANGNLPQGYGVYRLRVLLDEPGHLDQPTTLTEVAFLATEPKPAGGTP